MAVFNEPTKWAQTLGQDADVVSIPDTAGETDPSIDKIFPSVFSIPLANGGRAIPRSVLNGLFKLVGDWIYYIQNGGVPSYNPDYDYIVGRVILFTDGNLYKCIKANTSTDPHNPTDSEYWSKIPTFADFEEFGFNTGDIKIQTTATIPNGWLLCNGAGISRSTFSNLFTKIGTTYGVGDGSTTFNIPDLRDRYIIGANTNALGTQVAEQLPNITGGSAVRRTNSGESTFWASYGAFSDTSTTGTTNLLSVSGIGNWGGTSFDASNSNNIYTDNGKVYPASIALNFIIKT